MCFHFIIRSKISNIWFTMASGEVTLCVEPDVGGRSLAGFHSSCAVPCKLLHHRGKKKFEQICKQRVGRASFDIPMGSFIYWRYRRCPIWTGLHLPTVQRLGWSGNELSTCLRQLSSFTLDAFIWQHFKTIFFHCILQLLTSIEKELLQDQLLTDFL